MVCVRLHLKKCAACLDRCEIVEAYWHGTVYCIQAQTALSAERLTSVCGAVLRRGLGLETDCDVDLVGGVLTRIIVEGSLISTIHGIASSARAELGREAAGGWTDVAVEMVGEGGAVVARGQARSWVPRRAEAAVLIYHKHPFRV